MPSAAYAIGMSLKKEFFVDMSIWEKRPVKDFMQIRKWRLKENIKTARWYIHEDLLIDVTLDPS